MLEWIQICLLTAKLILNLSVYYIGRNLISYLGVGGKILFYHLPSLVYIKQLNKMSKQNLALLSGNLLQIFSELEENGGDLTPELEQALQITKDDLDVKVQSYNFMLTQLKANNEAIQKEQDRLLNLSHCNDVVIQKLEERLLTAVQSLGTEDKGVYTLNLPTITLKTRKSTSVKVEGEVDSKYKQYDLKLANLDDETATKIKTFLESKNYKVNSTMKVSKTKIKEDLENKVVVLNAKQVVNYTLVIK